MSDTPISSEIDIQPSCRSLLRRSKPVFGLRSRQPQQVQQQLGQSRVVVELGHQRYRIGVEAVAGCDTVPIQSSYHWHLRLLESLEELQCDEAVAKCGRVDTI